MKAPKKRWNEPMNHNPFSDFSFCRLIVRFEVLKPVLLPPYSGSTIQGWLGNLMNQVKYDKEREDCQACPVQFDCRHKIIRDYLIRPPAIHPLIYHHIQDIPESEHYDLNYPAPVIIEPVDSGLKMPGTELKLEMIIVGRALNYIQFLLCVLKCASLYEIGEKYDGVGGLIKTLEVSDDTGNLIMRNATIFPDSACTLYDISSIRADLSSLIHTSNDNLKIGMYFVTPFQYKHDQKLNPLINNFDILFKLLVRRLRYLSLYTRIIDKEMCKLLFDAPESYGKLANNISCENRLEDFRWNKYSSTSAQRYDIDGKIGKIILRGDLKPFLLIIKLAEYFHIGRKTNYGMGRYILEIEE